MRVRPAVALLLSVSVGAGCGRAVNYLDPDGPLHALRRGESARPVPRAGAPFRVASFNVAHAIEIDRAIEALRSAPELRGADALALQEMDAPGAERIARALGLHSVYFPSGVHPAHRRDFGCAVLSPWPLERPEKLVLPHGARVSGLRRAAVSATVVRGSERVRVYSVHLPAPLSVSPGARREQLLVLAEDARRREGPVVIAGDFNSGRAPSVLARAGFAWPTRGLGGTTRVRLFGLGRDLDYDHVLVRGLDVYAAGIVTDNRGASDHRPIWALLAAPPR